MRALLLVLLPWLLIAAEGAALPGVQELHGSFHGEPFWLRLRLPNASYQGHRVLELLYQPPAPGSLGGTILRGHPDVLVDDQLRVIAWKERGDAATAALWRGGQASRYESAYEFLDDDTFQVVNRQQEMPAPVWERTLAPLLALLVRPEALPLRGWCLSLFQRGPRQPLPVVLDQDELRIGDERYAVRRDPGGGIITITDASGTDLVRVGPVPLRPLGGEDMQIIE
ncbi:MAG: hypothetical protein ACOCXA_01715 [Planctomycetota bacterium]